MKKQLTYISIICLVFVLFSCSNQNALNPSSADLPDDNTLSINTNRSLGYYTVTINPQNETTSIEINRTANLHLNAKQYLLGWPCANCLRILNFQMLPNNQIELDIEVEHPVSDPYLTAFDLRVIAIFPADEYIDGFGVSYALLNRDGLTTLWDNAAIAGEINGYKAYNKEVDRRPFLPDAILTEHFLIQLPDGTFQFDIGVDASWHDNDGITFPDLANSIEVIDLDGYIEEGITTGGGLAELVVSMYDYQRTYQIGNIIAYCDPLFLNPKPLNLVYSDGHNITYNDLISNEKHAPCGVYSVLVKVKDNEWENYPYDVSSYIVLDAEVFPSDIEITLAEMDNYKTPGNYYKFYSCERDADHNVIDYFDTNGPWDFTTISYTDETQRTILIPSDPEIAHFIDEFPDADRVIKEDGNFGFNDGEFFQPEKFNYVQMKNVPLGIYEVEHFGGTVVFDIDDNSGFPFPYNINTSFVSNFDNGSIMSVSYDTLAIGMGACTIPLDSENSRSAILFRTVMEASIIVPIFKVLKYEWYDDDGNLLAFIFSINSIGQPDKWNESTYEMSWGGFVAMYEMHRQ